jgi:PKHD-type hydroxylase
MELKPTFPYKQGINQTNYYWFNGGFSSEEVDRIVEDAKEYSFVKGVIVDEDNTDNFRKSNIKWLPFDSKWEWVIDKIMNQVMEANDAIWNFDLKSIIDNIQYTEYDGNGGHYDWHMDIGPGAISHRKISIVVQLSDPSDYVGGDLELKPGCTDMVIPRGKGNVVVFPSFLLHRVVPLTSGNRKSLVLWVGGDHYK